jgi:hypothetical protein
LVGGQVGLPINRRGRVAKGSNHTHMPQGLPAPVCGSAEHSTGATRRYRTSWYSEESLVDLCVCDVGGLLWIDGRSRWEIIHAGLRDCTHSGNRIRCHWEVRGWYWWRVLRLGRRARRTLYRLQSLGFCRGAVSRLPVCIREGGERAGGDAAIRVLGGCG